MITDCSRQLLYAERPGSAKAAVQLIRKNIVHIVGWPEAPDADGGILPVAIVDVDFQGTPEELRAIGEFLLKAAAELDVAKTNNSALYLSIDLGNSNPRAEVGLHVNVVRHTEA